MIISSNPKNAKFCYWDKHEFNNLGVLCPIFYKPRQVIRKKKEYYINENIEYNKPVLKNEIVTEPIIYYDDKFCSYNCCIAWLDDNFHNPKYKNSKQILYNELLQKNIPIPKKANHWRLLKSFGGPLEIEIFRKFDITYEIEDEKFSSCVKKYDYKLSINM